MKRKSAPSDFTVGGDLRQRRAEQGMKDRAASCRNKIRLAPGRHVRVELRQDWHVLVQPAGTVQLNASAAAILELCDGTRTCEEIIAHILPRSADDGLACDVREFLDAARRRGWIIEA
jgi:pyrroloquinoline quinone biosynthesis protein D